MGSITNLRTRPQPGVVGVNTMAPIFYMRSIVIVAMLTSGLTHIALTPEHLREAPLLGLGFFMVGTCQVALGLAFHRRPMPAFWPVAVMLNVFSLSAYVLSRTLGLPFEGDHIHESIAVADLMCKGAELLSIVALLPSIHTTTRTWPTGPSLRMAPYNRYAYLVALVVAGAVAALYLAHGHS